jgi:hypothetical protein
MNILVAGQTLYSLLLLVVTANLAHSSTKKYLYPIEIQFR